MKFSKTLSSILLLLFLSLKSHAMSGNDLMEFLKGEDQMKL